MTQGKFFTESHPFNLIHHPFIFHEHDSSDDEEKNHANQVTADCKHNMFIVDDAKD